MAVRIRLARFGRKKKPFYRLVVADHRAPRDGSYIEQIGTYDPMKEPSEIKIEEERALYWLGNGALPSETARSLLAKCGVWEKFTAGKKQ
ncbi:MAG: 30S ribosomal protein S16 [Thermovirgaceae bacterium]|jgi:small subunit ribosomal protein S16